MLDSLLIGGLRFVFDKIAAAVDTELNDDTALREQLLAAQMRVELGEMSAAGVRRARGGHPRAAARDPRSEAGCRRRHALAGRLHDHRHRRHLRRRRGRTEPPLPLRRRQGRRRQDDVRGRHRASPRPRPGRRTLVISTDPAPSLGDAFERALGPGPRQDSAAPRLPGRRRDRRARGRSTRWLPRAPRRARTHRAARHVARSRTTSRGCCGCRCRASTSSRRSSRSAALAADRPLRSHRRRHGADGPYAAHAVACRTRFAWSRACSTDAVEASRAWSRRCAAHWTPDRRRRAHRGDRSGWRGPAARCCEIPDGCTISWVTLPSRWRSRKPLDAAAALRDDGIPLSRRHRQSPHAEARTAVRLVRPPAGSRTRRRRLHSQAVCRPFP